MHGWLQRPNPDAATDLMLFGVNQPAATEYSHSSTNSSTREAFIGKTAITKLFIYVKSYPF